jgi:hypothetical protein
MMDNADRLETLLPHLICVKNSKKDL